MMYALAFYLASGFQDGRPVASEPQMPQRIVRSYYVECQNSSALFEFDEKRDNVLSFKVKFNNKYISSEILKGGLKNISPASIVDISALYCKRGNDYGISGYITFDEKINIGKFESENIDFYLNDGGIHLKY